MDSICSLSIVIPVYNSADTIGSLVEQLANLPIEGGHELILVNDGSKDKTRIFIDELSQEFPAVKVLHFSRNFGKETAINAGLEHISGEVTVIIDADFQ
ncbi:MAG: glycosyltransferase, partial [Tolypothrix sp. T3-bin4]|nr:glycosyltransferase [Tolypothrix sp. T3-bin4]